MLSPLQSWHGLPLMPTSAPRPPQAQQQQASPPAPAEGDGPLNLSKPKSSHGSASSGGSSSGRSPVMTSLNGNGTRSPPCPGQASMDTSRNVPPGLVLPPTFMPFATFPMSSGKTNGLLACACLSLPIYIYLCLGTFISFVIIY